MVIGFTLGTAFVCLTGLLVLGLCKASASGDRAAGYIHAELLEESYSPETGAKVVGIRRVDINDTV